MKLKTSLSIAFCAMLLVPILLCGISITAVSRYQMRSIEETYGIEFNLETLTNTMQIISEYTESIRSQLEQTAEAVTTESTEVAQVEKEAENETAETGAGANVLHFDPEDGMLWPMEGNVILNYSMDSTVYFATLDQYKYNPAVIIAGEVNNKVYSVAKGKVIGLSNNEETGCTMTVDLGDGYRAIYGQLKEPNFAVGDYVESGHVLGYVAEPTKYYSVEGSNLYFALQKDGQPVDPVAFFQS